MKNKLSDLNDHLFAQIERLGDEDLSDEQIEKEAKRADLYTQYAVAASVQAMNDAGFTPGTFDNDRAGVIVGSGIGGLKSFEEQHDI